MSISVLDIITSGIEARLAPGLRRPFRQMSDLTALLQNRMGYS
jgi:hypothetical protein